VINIQGASLRVVVRSQAKGDALKSVFPKYVDKIQIAIAENNETPGAYDTAVQGVDIVVHMASPLPGTAGTDNESGYLIPARDGIVNMLKSASKSSSVKRVVMTSSSTAVVDSKIPSSVPYCHIRIRLILGQSYMDGERLEFIDLGRWKTGKS
jgi:nucleoside-diphosphate-sugar epimerase